MKYQVLEKFLYKKIIEYFKKIQALIIPPVNFIITFIV